jgi:ATP-dependent RNA helicase DeaD
MSLMLARFIISNLKQKRLKTFEELGVSAEILQAIKEMGFVNPMPVQEEVIPYLLGTGNDVIALAQTGTGKTAAYGLPLLQKLDVTDSTTQAVILSPTRELCLQIAGDLEDFCKYMKGVHVLPVYGGSSIDLQIRALKRGVQIIVATPGRLIDLMERGAAKLDAVKNVVLDEADEMLSMGFSESIDTILAGVPTERNTLLFSATMSKEIERIAKNYLHDYKEIVVGSRNEGAEHVNHIYYLVHAKDKYLALKRIVDYYPKIYAIVFCRTRMETAEVADKLIQDGYNADALHGDLSQQQRDLTMQRFRQHRVQLLVATDVAARGLDVDDLTHVINYGLPDDIENYTHRSGRTGRAGKEGTSISIIHIREKSKVRAIEKAIGKEFVQAEIPSGSEICGKQLYKVIDDIEHAEVNDEEIEPFMPEVFRKLEWMDKEDLIRRVVTRNLRIFLRYYADAPEIETPTASEGRGRGERSRDRGDRGDRGERGGERSRDRGDRGERGGSRQAEAGYKRLFLNVGKLDGFYAREIMGLVNANVRDHVDIGRIDLMPSFSFFEVPEDQADKVVHALSNVDVKGRRVSVEVADGKNVHSDGGGHASRDRSFRHDDRPYGHDDRSEGRGRRGESRFSSRDDERGGARRGARDEGRSRRSEERPSEEHQLNRRERRAAKFGAPVSDEEFKKRSAKADEGEAPRKDKPTRAERGYSEERGPIGNDNDWKQFFQHDKKPLVGDEPDFSEEGWARRKPKK